MKKLLITGFALALGACAAQQSAMNAPAAQAPESEAAVAEDRSAAAREERRRRDQRYVTTLERRDVTGSRINRVRRRGEPDEDKTAGKRVDTISREQIDELEELGMGSVSEALPPGE